MNEYEAEDGGVYNFNTWSTRNAHVPLLSFMQHVFVAKPYHFISTKKDDVLAVLRGERMSAEKLQGPGSEVNCRNIKTSPEISHRHSILHRLVHCPTCLYFAIQRPNDALHLSTAVCRR